VVTELSQGLFIKAKLVFKKGRLKVIFSFSENAPKNLRMKVGSKICYPGESAEVAAVWGNENTQAVEIEEMDTRSSRARKWTFASVINFTVTITARFHD
jgi:hypothetical protein